MDTKTVEEFFRPFRSVLIAADKAKRGVQVQCTERGADLCLARGPRASCLPRSHQGKTGAHWSVFITLHFAFL
jgi:hypothetical protein